MASGAYCAGAAVLLSLESGLEGYLEAYFVVDVEAPECWHVHTWVG